MRAEDLLHKVLEIEVPWQIVRIRDDLGKRQVDVWVAEQTGKGSWLFGARTAALPEGSECAWRHANLGDTRCVIHAEASAQSPTQGWRGEAGQPFTNAMARLIVGLMRDGVRLHSICAMLDISVGDLWKFKHGLDSGKTGLAATLVSAQADAGAAAARVPEPDSAIWAGMLDGTVNIDIRLLSLKFLLTKMREQMRVIIDSEVRTLKCYELQRFFVRNEKTLGHEISQIVELA